MTAKLLTLEKGWYRQDREPVNPKDKLKLVQIKDMESVKDCPKFMTVKYVADYLEFSQYAVYTWIKAEQLKAQTIHGRLRVMREDLARFLISEDLKG